MPLSFSLGLCSILSRSNALLFFLISEAFEVARAALEMLDMRRQKMQKEIDNDKEVRAWVRVTIIVYR